MTKWKSNNGRVFLFNADCLKLLQKRKNNSIDAIVTDPPAGISFMGKAFDSDRGGRDKWIAWLRTIMEECLRVLKPGGHMLCWALPRTSYWTAMAIDDAGFEIRDRLSHLSSASEKVRTFWNSLDTEQRTLLSLITDESQILHIFGSGFPKSANISKNIDKAQGAEREVVGANVRLGDKFSYPKHATSDFFHPNKAETMGNITTPATPAAKQWDGWHTSLKPSTEVWWLCRKPLEGTVAENVLKHGTGGINVGATRVGVTLPANNPLLSAFCNAHACVSAACQDVLRGIASALRSYNIEYKVLLHNEGDPCDNQPKDAVCDALLSRLYPNGVWCGLNLYEGKDFQYDCHHDCRLCDELVRRAEEAARGGPPLLADVLDDIDLGLSKLQHNHERRSNAHLSKHCHVCIVASLINLLLGSNTTLYTSPPQKQGRFPSHLLLSHAAGCRKRGTKKVKAAPHLGQKNPDLIKQYGGGCFGGGKVTPAGGYASPDGTETVDNWQCVEGCPVAELNRQSGECPSGRGNKAPRKHEDNSVFGFGLGYSPNSSTGGDTGGASRFFQTFDAGFLYCAKASRNERNEGCEGLEEKQQTSDTQRTYNDRCATCGKKFIGSGCCHCPPGEKITDKSVYKNQNNHPTVKSVALMQYFCRLITPPGGIVLDPFMGSGSTGIAAVKEGFRFAGIELDEGYFEIAVKRIKHELKKPKGFDL